MARLSLFLSVGRCARHYPRGAILCLFDSPRNVFWAAQRCQRYATDVSGTSSAVANSDNMNVSHSRFLAEASPSSKWKKGSGIGTNYGKDPSVEEFEGVKPGKGKLSPTSSHLFKLILPLGNLSHPANKRSMPTSLKAKSEPDSSQNPPETPPTVFLLHPSQPLSHLSRLILASLAPATPNLSYRSRALNGQAFQWSDSTDIGDFIRDAARSANFVISITYGDPVPPSENLDTNNVVPVAENLAPGIQETLLDVEVPTFADRTRFLRRRLKIIENKLRDMEVLKQECDAEAHRGAKRMAVGGFGMLIVYWALVARLTFWDYGWDIMEPITYLSGLSTVILGYLWFLYQGREVSYSNVLHNSISTRREALYKARELDIEQWVELNNERKSLKKEIGHIAEDYHDHGKTGESHGSDKGSDDSSEDGELQRETKDRDSEAEAGKTKSTEF